MPVYLIKLSIEIGLLFLWIPCCDCTGSKFYKKNSSIVCERHENNIKLKK